MDFFGVAVWKKNKTWHCIKSMLKVLKVTKNIALSRYGIVMEKGQSWDVPGSHLLFQTISGFLLTLIIKRDFIRKSYMATV